MYEIVANKKKQPEFKMIAITQLTPGEYQPRHQFDPITLNDLAKTIRQVGILMPLLVRQTTPTQYEIIAGERRWRAAKLAELVEVPCMISHAGDQETLINGLIENLSREDLNPIEEAKGIAKLIEEFDFSHEAVADIFNRSRSEITNVLRLLKLDLKVQQMIIKRELNETHGRLLAGIHVQEQYPLACQTVMKGWSSRILEKMIQLQKKPLFAQKKPRPSADLLKLEAGLSGFLGTKVRVETKGKETGQVQIDYASLEILEGILEKMGWCEE